MDNVARRQGRHTAHHTGEETSVDWLRSGLGLGRGGWSASMRNAAARTVHAELGRGWTGQKGGRGDTMGLHLVSGWWCRGCRGLHGEGARWRRIGRDEVTSCGRCIPKAGRCNAGVGRASSFGPFLDRIGSSGTGMHSNLLRSRQALEPMKTQKRPADRKHGPASHGTKEQEPHSAGRRGQGLGVVEVRDQGCIAFICRTGRLQDCRTRRAAGVVPSAVARASLLIG